MADPITQVMRPIGPGVVPDPYLTNPDRGFFHTPSNYAFWQTVLNRAIVNGTSISGGYSGWAVTDGNLVHISVALDPFEGGDDDIINWIKVYAQVSSGINQSTGASVNPSGSGNYFNIGMLVGDDQTPYYTEFWAYTSDFVDYVATFTEKADGSLFTGKDLRFLEWYLRYGYYWTTSDKGLTANDNAHNTIGQAWIEVNYTPVTKGGAASILLL